MEEIHTAVWYYHEIRQESIDNFWWKFDEKERIFEVQVFNLCN